MGALLADNAEECAGYAENQGPGILRQAWVDEDWGRRGRQGVACLGNFGVSAGELHRQCEFGQMTRHRGEDGTQ